MAEKELLEKETAEKGAGNLKPQDALEEKQTSGKRSEAPLSSDLSADADTTVGEAMEEPLESVVGEVVNEPSTEEDPSEANTALVETQAAPPPEPFLGRGFLAPYQVEETDQITFYAVSGKVLETKKYTETHISSSGGGGYASASSEGGSFVHISAPKIESKVLTNLEFWIQTSDGEERAIKLPGVDIPMREGQIITLISAHKPENKEGTWTLLVNHNAKNYWTLSNGKFLTDHFGIAHETSFYAAFGAIGAIAIPIFTPIPFALTGLLGLGFVGYMFFKNQGKYEEVRKTVDDHLEAITGEVFQKTAELQVLFP